MSISVPSSDTSTPAGPELADDAIPEVVWDAIANPLAMGAAGANVIMQLALLPVGHGVAKSPVESGRVDKHPVKRARTTLSFLVVAMVGNRAERLYLRREINRSHQPVRSTSDDPVAYNAFDRDLQLWVAACLYRGFETAYTMMYPSPDARAFDVLYQHSARLATTLQVRPEAWPPDRDAFEAYWASTLPEIRMDDLSRGYLDGIARLRFLPAPVPQILGPFHRWVTAGFLPGEFRDEMGLPWSDRSQRLFDTINRVNGLAMRATPRSVRLLPWHLLLWNVRRRMSCGRPFV